MITYNISKSCYIWYRFAPFIDFQWGKENKANSLRRQLLVLRRHCKESCPCNGHCMVRRHRNRYLNESFGQREWLQSCNKCLNQSLFKRFPALGPGHPEEELLFSAVSSSVFPGLSCQSSRQPPAPIPIDTVLVHFHHCDNSKFSKNYSSFIYFNVLVVNCHLSFFSKTISNILFTFILSYKLNKPDCLFGFTRSWLILIGCNKSEHHITHN